MKIQLLSLLLLFTLRPVTCHAQSIARDWNELLLKAIRNDLARPTVHARNLFHLSAAQYDAWAAYESGATPYFLGQTHRGFHIAFEGAQVPDGMSKREAQEIALSMAYYRLLKHRFERSPALAHIEFPARVLLRTVYADTDYTQSTNYLTSPADLGNYIAEQIIAFGLMDGSNEASDYLCRFYEPTNNPMYPDGNGSSNISDPNRWQPLAFDEFVGQSGISEGPGTPKFVGAEWGQVAPFALDESTLSIKRRDGHDYLLHLDPGPPTYLELSPDRPSLQDYQWGFGLVAQWSSHHDPADSVRWDISPNAIGNIPLDQLPKSPSDYPQFYDFENGGDISTGYTTNPSTGQPYPTQTVLRADYTRVLAEFWADGPDSETPPGHWHVLLNYVTDHDKFERLYQGQGTTMDALEWNIKSYFALSGALHDAAIAAWGAKGYYDYIRPISAIRSMAERGQSTDPNAPHYHPAGLPLIPGQVELITADDPLNAYGHLENKIKIRAWKVPGRYYESSDTATHVDWIEATRWQPYQRPTFVTPPFAGYVSGHSTFSRAAAEMLSLLTGSEYFPGGVGEFLAAQNNFLVFETGPSEDITLQWARYQDASDQCSLSRIWGGIHPPVDDIAGRLMGYEIGHQAFALAEKYFNGTIPPSEQSHDIPRFVYGPNPVSSTNPKLTITLTQPDDLPKTVSLYDSSGQLVLRQTEHYVQEIVLNTVGLKKGVYLLTLETKVYNDRLKLIVTP
ncbi:hypothetical protein BFP72_14900 [Reichenbachiella sp. 5M10]|uniref:T9SS type A sorting domain-containing protein n=1 Tax=Reichenbachiella sp. 5M10 TaxID=1889772 RepID=UPI000C14C97D|nr:T9SS type A sorting domain-containing protein [Reichenbachiella sp. 5M10]PIB36597.1 hypothetical protein BFP72_14900 [Reichenbachiella sp. 5M10]